MSNTTNIIQQTTTIKHNGETFKEVVVSDDYEMGVICLDGYSDTFYKNDLELLAMVIKIAIDSGGLESVRNVLTTVQENKTGIHIENTWYDWEEVKDVLETNNV